MNKVKLTVKLRLASGVHVFTVPAEIVQRRKWQVGDEFDVKLDRIKRSKRGD